MLLLAFWLVCWAVGAIGAAGGALGWMRPLSVGAKVWIALGFLALSFVGNALAERRKAQTVSFTLGTAHERPVTLELSRYGMGGSLINPVAPDSLASYVSLITSLLFIGPSMLTVALRGAARARRLRRLDLGGCARVLESLASRPRRASFAEIARALPGLDAPRVFAGLADIRGVVFPDLRAAGARPDRRPQARTRGGLVHPGPRRHPSGKPRRAPC